MGDWLNANVGPVLAGVVALVVAGVGVATAEGGRTRRKLRRIKEEIELLALLAADDGLSKHRAALKAQVDRRLRTYVLTPRQRWVQRAIVALVTLALAGALFSVYDAARGSKHATFDNLYYYAVAGLGILLAIFEIIRERK